MKIFKNIALMLVAGLALWSCESRQKTELNPKLIQPAVFTTYPTAEITLDKNQPSLAQVVFAWNPAQYGYSAGVKYTLQAYVAGTTLAPVELGQTNGTSISVQNKALAAGVVALGGVPLEKMTINIRLLSTVGVAISDTVSLPIALTVIPFSLVPTPLWVAGGYCGWHPDDPAKETNATKIYSENSNGIYKGWVYMVEAGKSVDEMTEFKFTTRPNWSGTNYGGTMDALSTDGGAGNIEIPGGYCYLFDVNTIELKATTPKKFKRLGLVGNATPNDWNSPDTELKYNYTTHTFKASGVVMKAGEFKFRANDNWDGPDWGANGKAGTLNLEGGGGNIAFDAPGTYTVEVDLFKSVPTYTLTKE